MKKAGSVIVAMLVSGIGAAHAAGAVTYTYDGPAFTAGTDHVSISFTCAAPLAPSTSYLSLAAASVTAGAVQVVGPSGPLAGFTLPITAFQIHTDGSGAIDSWFVFGESKTLTGVSPSMTGTDWQAYSMNTLAFIPGSDVPGATGLVTGAYDYDQATETTFYTSCSSAPPGSTCSIAGNGQPYVGNYSGIINPSNTSGASWTVTGAVAPPPAAALAIGGTLPDGLVDSAYGASLTASGGTAPYSWSATGLPAGLALVDGTVSGVPTVPGSFAVVVTLTDSAGAAASATFSVAIAPLVCSGTDAVVTSVGRDFIVVNGGLVLADHVWYTPTPAGTTFLGGLTSFATGELVDYVGDLDPVAGCYATAMTVKPAPNTLSCTRPKGAKRSSGKGTVTAVGYQHVMVGSRRIDYGSCTALSYGGGATAPAVGDAVDWEGYVEPNGDVMSSTLTFN